MDKEKLKGINEAAKKVQGQLNKAKDSLAKVDWKKKSIFTIQVVLLLLVLLLHVYSTFDNFRLGTNVRFICLASTLIAGISAFFLFKFVGIDSAAIFAFSLFVLPIAVSGIFYGGQHVKGGFSLAGFSSNFWVNLSCLGSIGIVVFWLVIKPLNPFLKAVFVIPFLYLGMGFLVGISKGLPLEMTIMGPGFFLGMPLPAQPGYLYLNIVCPLIFAGTLLMGLISLVNQEFKTFICQASVGILFLTVLAMGFSTMNRNLIPNISMAVKARTPGTGYAKVTYYSDWDESGGKKEHEAEVFTKGFDPGSKFREGSKSDYLISMGIQPPLGPNQKTLLRLMIKDRDYKSDVMNLLAKDLVLREDGNEQDFTLTSKIGQTTLIQTDKVVMCMDGNLSYWWRWHDHAPKKAIKAFIQQVNSCYDILMLQYGYRGSEDISNGFVSDGNALVQILDSIDWHSGGHPLDGLMSAYDQLEDLANGNGIIVMFAGDAEIEGDKFTVTDVMDRIASRNIQLFILGLNCNVEVAKVYREMAAKGNGAYLHAPSEQDFIKKSAQLFDNFSCLYEIEYEKKLGNTVMSQGKTTYTGTKGSGTSGSSSSYSGSSSSSSSSDSSSSNSNGSSSESSSKKKTPDLEIRLAKPVSGIDLTGSFPIRAYVKGKTKTVEFLIDDIPVKSFSERKDETYEYQEENFDDYKSGSHVVLVRATDQDDNTFEAKSNVVFKRETPEISISSPSRESTNWKSFPFEATVSGKSYEKVGFSLDGKETMTFKPEAGPKFTVPSLMKDCPAGNHSFKVSVYLKDGKKIEDSVSYKTIVPKPTVKIMSPKEGQQVFGNVPIQIQAESGWMETKLNSVKIIAGEKELAGEKAPTGACSAELSAEWQTKNVEPGKITLKVIVENEIGETATTQIVVEVIKPEFFVSFANIAQGQVLRKDTTVTLELVNSFPGTTIENTQIWLDQVPLTTLTADPWQFPLNVLKMKNGEHELKATAVRSDKQTFDASVRFVANPPKQISLYFSVRDSIGKTLPLKALQELNFDVQEDSQKVTQFNLESAENLPVNFGIIIDVSGSMSQEYRLEKAKEAAIAFVDNMKENDKAFLMRFSDQPELLLELTNDKRKLQQEIEYFTPKRGTALYDAIFTGVDQILNAKDRPAIVLLTDGIDENAEQTGPGSTHSLKEAIEYARRSEVQIYTIGLGRGLKMKDSMGEQVLTGFAKLTGGEYFFAPSGAELAQIFRKIISEVANQAKLTFVPPSGGNDGAIHKITLQIPGKAELKVLYKPTYTAK
ncbi:MAG: VWA domain-containing protein [Candidatus Riflebacteria bacterium]|nr:VWA domain-containing protein [Candidatus Riflebacteria bacterium]